MIMMMNGEIGMTNPVGIFNDALMGLDLTIDEFRRKYPDENILFSSSGFYTYAKGRKRDIPFMKRYTKKYGNMILSDRRAYFSYDAKSPHNWMNKFFLARILLYGVVCLILMAVIPLIIPQMLICSLISIGITVFLLLFAILFFMKKRTFDLDILYSDLLGMGFFNMSMMMRKMDLLIMYDGRMSYFMIPNNRISDEVKMLFSN